ncbi:hypothetical protein N0V84_001825 [Fusarium piperis]|uniref:Uncharacterized protein n=1 Tax=Fusarium piperis TaxID=1435070 RepID=A0A9W8WL45_9HYPO|nr:hypothetical protein N0V84_001825 [Fusarium piperis]
MSIASPNPTDTAALPQTPSSLSMPAPFTASRDAGESITCAGQSSMASPKASDSMRSAPDLLPTKPVLSKSTLADVTKALEVGHPLEATHMCALLATYPSLGKDSTIVHPSYFDVSPPSTSSRIPHRPLPYNKVLLAPLQHYDPNHWSLVRIQREGAHRTVICRHYDPTPSAQRLQEVERVMKLWAKLHHPGWDVRVSEVSGPRAASSALSGLYVALGADEFPATCSFAPTWKPKSPQSAVLAALERYDRAASTDSGVSMEEEDPSRTSSSGQSSKRSDSKKGTGIGTAKRSKGSLMRPSLSKLSKEKSPVTTPKKASPLLSEKNLPSKPKLPGTPQSEQPPRESSKLNVLTTVNDGTLPPTPSAKRPRSGSLSENPSGGSEASVKKRCTPGNRDTGGTIQDIDAFLQGLAFPSPEQATADMEGSCTAMMTAKAKLREAIEELKVCDQEYAERFETYNQNKKDWKDLSDKIEQDTSNLEDWFNNMPTMNTMTSEQCGQFQSAFEANLNHHRGILKEKHGRMQSSNGLLKSAEEVCDANKAKVAKLEVALSEKEAEYRELMKRNDVAKVLSEFGERLNTIKAKWEN